MDDQYRIEFLPDDEVDEELDRRLRELLCSCFTGPANEGFREHRYWLEPPQYRWFIREDDGRVIAHVAVHDKTLGCEDGDLRVAGVAEVSVHPDYRRRGLVKLLLGEAHRWLAKRGFEFGLLSGDPNVYRSSGYALCENVFRFLDFQTKEWVEKTSDSLQFHVLSDHPWPKGKIDLRGPYF